MAKLDNITDLCLSRYLNGAYRIMDRFFGRETIAALNIVTKSHTCERCFWSLRFFNQESTKICRHETALDAHGRRLIVTSDSVRSPIYQVQGHMSGFRTLPHTAAVTTVDWHPTLPIYLTGSADHSVRVTSIL
ncbi:hypothetical protein C5167_015331 [Papaver somniferum]|uniref:Uncharacterized protein n=1 Tax=Papaver somniferum TaxID=3469 RepID=A0A4Y7J6N0_PAPSO|nr:hypothetical protein C5167_015331 [Papaver somniferum]